MSTGFGFKTFLTKTDNESYMVWVHCWEDGETTWVVYSKESELRPETKWEILYHVRGIGFQPADRRETDYINQCPLRGRSFEQIQNEVVYLARKRNEQA